MTLILVEYADIPNLFLHKQMFVTSERLSTHNEDFQIRFYLDLDTFFLLILHITERT